MAAYMRTGQSRVSNAGSIGRSFAAYALIGQTAPLATARDCTVALSGPSLAALKSARHAANLLLNRPSSRFQEFSMTTSEGWQRPLVSGVTYWLGYQRQLFRSQVPEGALTLVAATILRAQKPLSVRMNHALPELSPIRCSHRQVDIAVLEDDSLAFVVEVKSFAGKAGSTRSVLEQDILRLAIVQRCARDCAAFFLAAGSVGRMRSAIRSLGGVLSFTDPKSRRSRYRTTSFCRDAFEGVDRSYLDIAEKAGIQNIDAYERVVRHPGDGLAGHLWQITT
jgi:hypothetical protein